MEGYGNRGNTFDFCVYGTLFHADQQGRGDTLWVSAPGAVGVGGVVVWSGNRQLYICIYGNKGFIQLGTHSLPCRGQALLPTAPGRVGIRGCEGSHRQMAGALALKGGE